MKPIKLRFTGLNSYRAQQVVDFESLGADGLFGIFGPTGSGKSTILDAITLALYGWVDRASNNTQGIIHQLEKSLEVSFEFELGGCRYIVERRYDRSPKDPDSVVAKQARLRKINPNSEDVLASKPQEVTTKVEDILGINRDEFSRAVILPQGKFDQFLRLTGSYRADMLEHLFNLGQFGERLVAKVKSKTAGLVEQLQKIEGVEQGLGDCSEEAAKQAILDLKAKNDEYTEAHQAFETIEKSYKEAEAVQGLFLKRKNAQEQFNRLEQEQATMADKQARLNAAERAEPLRELIARQKDLNRKITEEDIAHQGKLHSHSEAVAKHKTANQELEVADKEYQEQLPQLQERKAKYQGAQEKQKKLKDIQESMDDKKLELDALQGGIAEAAKEVAACKSLSGETQTALETFQQERSKLIVNPDEKELLEQALTVLVRLEESEKRCQESRENHTLRKSQNDGQWVAVAEKVHEMLPDNSVAVDDDIEQLAQSLLDKIENDLVDARKEHQHALIVNSAAELVKELHEGEPCPVCGSLEHPEPAQSTGEIEKLANIVEVTESRLREARNWEGQLLRVWHDWRNNALLAGEAEGLAEKAEQELKEVAGEFEKVRGTLERDQIRKRKQELADFERQLHSLEQKREGIQKRQQELAEKLQNLTDSSQSDKIKEAAAQTELASLQSQLEDITKELNQITGGNDLDGLIRDMVQTYDRLQKAVQDTKRNEFDARTAMEALALEISALEATLNANRKELTDVEQRLTGGLSEAGFTGIGQAESVLLASADRQALRKELEDYRNALAIVRDEMEKLDREIDGRPFDEALFEQMRAKRQELLELVERLKEGVTLAKNKVEELRGKQEHWNELQKQKTTAEKQKSLAEELAVLLRGKKFVSFLAQEYLRDMTMEASYQLGRLTGQRYALELTTDKDCEFVIRDDYNGGNRRMISSLSGGEIFMTSLALALALSSKIQLRGKYPLGFFFLDEGFGSLDEDKLDKVMNALEKLHDRNRMVGVISHVRELKERLPRYLEVVAAGEDGSGSEIRIS